MAVPDDQAQPAQAPAAEVPARAAADFDSAVNLMRGGNTVEAELEFKQMIAAYPQLAAPRVNLALIHRKAGRLDEAEAELERAVERNPASAVAWNELGLTRRMRGEFGEAAQAYERAIAADERNAAAHRNFGVLLDLYLGDPERALVELERYKELSGEDKPVSGWIAELRQRTGKPAAPRKQTPVEASPDGAGDAIASDEGGPGGSS
jgi:tetratricopeptide (TPR) repeat protein